MILFANAKINLGLHLKEKRPDGYHNLETVFYPVPLYDVIEFYPAARFSLHAAGQKIPDPPEENLITKAYRLLKDRFRIQEIAVSLLKNIPPGSGLGGGSSDAAHLLSGLNQYFNLGLDRQQLRKLAGSLGSDCPFFIENQPVFATGKGDILHPMKVNLKGFFLVLAIPEIRIATEDAFSFCREPVEHKFPLREIINWPLEKWNGIVTNDFEKIIFPKYPVLQEIKDTLMKDGALYASLTGSGSAVFGIHKKRPLILTRQPFTQYLVIRF